MRLNKTKKKPVIKPKDVEEDKPEENIKEIKSLSSKPVEKNFMKRNWKAKILDRFKPNKTILIEMNHFNGTMSHMVIATKIHKFYYQDMAYIVDEDRKIYCNSTKLYMLRYHEGFAMPFQIDISAGEFRKNLPNEIPIKEISTSYNPYVLKDVLKMEYTKGVIQGAEVHEFIKKSFLMLIILLALGLIHFVVNAYKSGWI